MNQVTKEEDQMRFQKEVILEELQEDLAKSNSHLIGTEINLNRKTNMWLKENIK